LTDVALQEAAERRQHQVHGTQPPRDQAQVEEAARGRPVAREERVYQRLAFAEIRDRVEDLPDVERLAQVKRQRAVGGVLEIDHAEAAVLRREVA